MSLYSSINVVVFIGVEISPYQVFYFMNKRSTALPPYDIFDTFMFNYYLGNYDKQLPDNLERIHAPMNSSWYGQRLFAIYQALPTFNDTINLELATQLVNQAKEKMDLSQLKSSFNTPYGETITTQSIQLYTVAEITETDFQP